MSLGILTYWATSLIIYFFCIIPGFLLVYSSSSFNVIEKFMMSIGFSFAIFIIPLSIVAIFHLAFWLWIPLLTLCIIGLITFITFLRIKKQSQSDKHSFIAILNVPELKIVFLLFFVQFISKVFLATLLNHPVLGADWFRYTIVYPSNYLDHNWTPSQDRTPFFDLLITFFYVMFGNNFWIAQIFSCLANSALLLPAYSIASKFFGRKVGVTTFLLLIVNPYLIENALYTWAKNLTAYFVLLMFYFLFCKKNYLFSVFFSAFAFLSHPYALFYIASATLFLLITRKSRFFQKKLLYGLLLFALLLTPYFVWNTIAFGSLLPSRLIYYPFATQYYTEVYTTPYALIRSFFNTSLIVPVRNRLLNIIRSLIPIQVVGYLITGNYRFLLWHFYHTYPGALTLFLYLLVIMKLLRLSKTRSIISNELKLLSFVFLPFFLTAVYWGYPEAGFVRQTLQPTVPLLIMFATNELHFYAKKFSAWNHKLVLFQVFPLFLSGIEGWIFGKVISRFEEFETPFIDLQLFQETGLHLSDLYSAKLLTGGPQGLLWNIIPLCLMVFIVLAIFVKEKEIGGFLRSAL